MASDDTKKTQNIFELKKQLNEFLQKHPHLKESQAKIDDALKKAGTNPHNRAAVLNNMALELKMELKKALTSMLRESKKLEIELKKLKKLHDEGKTPKPPLQ